MHIRLSLQTMFLQLSQFGYFRRVSIECLFLIRTLFLLLLLGSSAAYANTTEIISPVPGSELTNPRTVFSWKAETANINRFILRAGTSSLGNGDILSNKIRYDDDAYLVDTDGDGIGDELTWDYSISLPMDGEKVYITLITELTTPADPSNPSGPKESYTQIYEYASIEGGTSMVSPVPGSELTNPNTVFIWKAETANINRFILRAGTSSSGNGDILSNKIRYDDDAYLVDTDGDGVGDELTWDYSISLPMDGEKVYITLITELTTPADPSNPSGPKESYTQIYEYASIEGGTSMVSPVPGSELTNPNTVFIWKAETANINRFILRAGTSSSGNGDILSNKIRYDDDAYLVDTDGDGVGDELTWDYSISLPMDGEKVYITLITELTTPADPSNPSGPKESYTQIYEYAPIEGGTSMVSPVPGSELTNPNTVFIWKAETANINRFILRAGTSSSGNGDILSNKIRYDDDAYLVDTDGDGVGDELTWDYSISLPMDGEKVYITLITELTTPADPSNPSGPKESYTQIYEYASIEGGTSMVSPVPGSELTNPSTVFIWKAETANINRFILRAGTSSLGNGDILSNKIRYDDDAYLVDTDGDGIGDELTWDYSISLPMDGEKVYITLITELTTPADPSNPSGPKESYTQVYEYASVEGGTSMVSPVPGSELTNPSTVFIWKAETANINRFILRAGTSSLGNGDILSNKIRYDDDGYLVDTDGDGIGDELTWDYSISLPMDGEKVYITLITELTTPADPSNPSGPKESYTQVYEYASIEGGTSMVSPVPGSELTNPNTLFEWVAEGDIEKFVIRAGTQAGSNNVAATRFVPGGGDARLFVLSIPMDGDPVYVTLDTHLNDGTSYRQVYLYYTIVDAAYLVAPVAGSTLTTELTSFQWSPDRQAQTYTFYAGTSVGANDVQARKVFPYHITSTVGHVPSTFFGAPIYVSLSVERLDGTNYTESSTFQTLATPFHPGLIRNPKINTTLDSRHAYVSWNLGQDVQSYTLEAAAGTSAAGGTVISSEVFQNTESSTILELPTNSEQITLKLITQFSDGSPDYIDTVSVTAANITFENNFELFLENTDVSSRGEPFLIESMHTFDDSIYLKKVMPLISGKYFSDEGVCKITPPSNVVACDTSLSALRVNEFNQINGLLYTTGQFSDTLLGINGDGQTTEAFTTSEIVVQDGSGTQINLQNLELYDVIEFGGALWVSASHYSPDPQPSGDATSLMQALILKSTDQGQTWSISHQQRLSVLTKSLRLEQVESQRLHLVVINEELFVLGENPLLEPSGQRFTQELVLLKHENDIWGDPSASDLSGLREFVAARKASRRSVFFPFLKISTFNQSILTLSRDRRTPTFRTRQKNISINGQLIISEALGTGVTSARKGVIDYVISDGYIYTLNITGQIHRSNNLDDWTLLTTFRYGNSTAVSIGVLNEEIYLSDLSGSLYKETISIDPIQKEFDIALIHPKAQALPDIYPGSKTTVRPLKAHNGKLYMGYGDWTINAGNADICHYNPSAQSAESLFVCNFTMISHAFETIYEFNGNLYFLGTDPSCDGPIIKCGHALVIKGVDENYTAIPESEFLIEGDDIRAFGLSPTRIQCVNSPAGCDTRPDILNCADLHLLPDASCTSEPYCSDSSEGDSCRRRLFQPYHFGAWGAVGDGSTQLMKEWNSSMTYISSDFGLTWAPESIRLGTQFPPSLSGDLYSQDTNAETSSIFNGSNWNYDRNILAPRVSSVEEQQLYDLAELVYGPSQDIDRAYSNKLNIHKWDAGQIFNNKLLMTQNDSQNNFSHLVVVDATGDVTGADVKQNDIFGYTISDGSIYVLKLDGRVLRSQDAESWEQVAYFYEGRGIIPSSFEVMNGVIYIGTQYGRVYERDIN